ncbi:FIST signal transduction protein [Sphaerotilus sp.]|jgi:small ligand-binding sensory domain FIST|uniref:FIST signal transduction protein n=1 Tax=Sphaerotilus sp. TaxID=2093942 RepID=UPI0025FB8646|nr:FIST N-terminal domain-containing protein [Sphaerotilus sp.]
MHTFLTAHATHPDAHMALALVAAQLDAQLAGLPPVAGGPDPFPLGFVYITDHYAARADALLAELRQRWPRVSWVGGVGVGVAVSGVEYFDEPALVLMLADLPIGSFELYSGERPLVRSDAHTALVHGDGQTPDMGELVAELAQRTTSGYLFGGLMASRGRSVQFCAPAAARGSAALAGVYEGGVSGVAFTREVDLLSRVSQGCQPIGPVRHVDEARDHIVAVLDGQSALSCLLNDLNIDLDHPREAVPRLRATLVGLTGAQDDVFGRGSQFGGDTWVRHLIGLDPMHHAVAVAGQVEPGMQLTFCTRNAEAARRDLVRICAEIREELSPDPDDEDSAATFDTMPPARRIAGALYVSCSGRGGPHFGGPSAELQLVRHALGDVPLVGFFASGEIARHHLYGYTAVLTVFVHA